MKRVNNTRRGVACNARIFTAIVMFAITFTFNGCSSDDDDGGGAAACKYTAEFDQPINGKKSGEVCVELSEKMLESIEKNEGMSKQELKKDCEEREVNGKFYDTCPKGHVSKCSEDIGQTVYLYGNEFKNINCEEFFNNL
ncbi:MAG: hypothetical protein LBH25_00850 [Fibromonadaceae bacterium]|nr:hypothetical protein [Fibromonadaceae bacterium]